MLSFIAILLLFSGHRWDICIFNNLISSTKWLHVSASASVGGEGMVFRLAIFIHTDTLKLVKLNGLILHMS